MKNTKNTKNTKPFLEISLSGKMAKTRNATYEKYNTYGIQVILEPRKETDYLVTGQRAGKQKMKKAYENKVKIITEEEFNDLLFSDYSEYLL